MFNAAGDVVLGPVNLHVGRSWAVTLSPDGRTIAVAGETGVELLALDGSGLMNTTTSVPAENDQALGVTDELIYSSERRGPVPRGTGTYLRCNPTCAVSNEVPRGGADTPFQGVNGWIPVESQTSSGPDTSYMWQIYDKSQIYNQAGRPHATGTSSKITVMGGVFVPRSGSWIALVLTDGPSDARGARSAGLDVAAELSAGFDGATRWKCRARPVASLQRLHRKQPAARHDDVEADPIPLGPTDAVDARFSPDGRWLVTASGRGDLTIRDPSTFDPIKVLSGAGAAGNGSWAPSLAVSDDSRFILSALDGRARSLGCRHG